MSYDLKVSIRKEVKIEDIAVLNFKPILILKFRHIFSICVRNN